MAYIGVENIARKIKKIYIGAEEVAHKVKKGYIGVDGVARQFFSSEITITYSGTHTISDVTVDNLPYKLWTITGSGTLAISGSVEYWMCGGGGTGSRAITIQATDPMYTYHGGGGGGGGYVKNGILQADTYLIGIGGKAGKTTITSNDGTVITALPGNNASDGIGASGGSGGGGGRCWKSGPVEFYLSSGKGAGVSTYPFGLTSLHAHCAGGAGGTFEGSASTAALGRNGGTNGSNGTTLAEGLGGEKGGGKGGFKLAGGNATFYGSGGGGGGRKGNGPSATRLSGGYGYQGVMYLLIPAALLAA